MNYVLIRHMAKKKCVPLNSTIVLLLISFIIISIFKQAIGSLDEVRWSRVNIPNEGNAGNWVLAEDSDIQHLVVASDGTIYCHADPVGTDYTLFKSADNGYSWSYIGRVKDDIVDIAIIPNETEHIYYATESNIYKSSDAGDSFTLLPYIPGLTDGNNVIISDIDVTRLDGNNIIIAGTRDTDKSQFGGIYLLDENEPLTGWIDTDIGNYDVHTVSFSPNYQSDLQIIAVVTDEKDTVVTTRIGDGNWGTVIGDAILSGIVPSSAVISIKYIPMSPNTADVLSESGSVKVTVPGPEILLHVMLKLAGGSGRLSSSAVPCRTAPSDMNTVRSSPAYTDGSVFRDIPGSSSPIIITVSP